MQTAPKQFWTILVYLMAAATAALLYMVPDAYLPAHVKYTAIGAAVGVGFGLPFTPPGAVDSEVTAATNVTSIKKP